MDIKKEIENLKISENAKGELTCPYCGGTYLVENAINIVNNEIINNNNFNGANVVINQNAKDAYIKQYLKNARRALSKDDFEEVEKYFPDKVFETKIPRNVRLSEAPSHGKPVMYYDKSSKGTEFYELLGLELLGEKAKPKEKRRLFGRKSK